MYAAPVEARAVVGDRAELRDDRAPHAVVVDPAAIAGRDVAAHGRVHHRERRAEDVVDPPAVADRRYVVGDRGAEDAEAPPVPDAARAPARRPVLRDGRLLEREGSLVVDASTRRGEAVADGQAPDHGDAGRRDVKDAAGMAAAHRDRQIRDVDVEELVDQELAARERDRGPGEQRGEVDDVARARVRDGLPQRPGAGVVQVHDHAGRRGLHRQDGRQQHRQDDRTRQSHQSLLAADRCILRRAESRQERDDQAQAGRGPPAKR